METVLIVGANGNTGTRIVEKIRHFTNYKPLAMIRNRDQEQKFQQLNVNTVLCDLEADVNEAVRKADKIIFAAGSGSATGPDKTIAVDQNGAIKIIDASKNSGIKKFVMLSAMGVDTPEDYESLGTYLKAKKKADEHLQNSGLAYTIVRPGRLIDNKGDGSIQAAGNLNQQGTISRDDVAEVLIECLETDLARDKTFEILAGNKKIRQELAAVE